MPLITWNARMSIGVDKFDEEHKKLVGMLNELLDAMQAGRGNEILGSILDELIEYTAVHFKHEEDDMDVYRYPKAAEHKQQHAELCKQVVEVQAKFKGGASATLSFEVLHFLKDWLIKHIQGSDKKFGAFLVEQQKKAS